MGPSKQDIPRAVEFIRNDLAKTPINTLILQFDYGYDFQSRAEFNSPSSPGRAEARQLVEACRDAGIELIPMINCLGHQSWAKTTHKLLRLYPEFDETPGKYPDNEGIYCRSYCPRHPEVHGVIFDLIDELIEDFEAKSLHVGMDEVFILGDEDCSRCAGIPTAKLFADEINKLNAHVRAKNCRLWLWGDRFLDAETTGLGKWEAADNGTAPAIDLVDKDIVVCDWHYERATDTPRYFAEKGFDVVICPWRKPEVAVEQIGLMRALRSDENAEIGRHGLGVLQTTWNGFSRFLNAYLEKSESDTSSNEVVTTFQAVIDELKK